MKNNNFRFSLWMILLFMVSCNNEELIVSSRINDAKVAGQADAGSVANVGSGSGTYYGAPISFNNASIKSFMTVSNFVPTAVGYEIDNLVFNNLPNAAAPGYTQIMLPVPGIPNTLVNNNLFKTLSFQWDPNGHDPQGIFSFPHFDFHCYMITESERLSIDGDSPSTMLAPDPVYIPGNYLGPIGPMSGMGSNYVDLLSPEFNGGSFTRTFNYVSYNGKVVCEEPMITLAYLTSSDVINDTMPIRQPAQYQVSGYYPTTYKTVRDSKITRVYLSDFVYRAASAPSF